MSWWDPVSWYDSALKDFEHLFGKSGKILRKIERWILKSIKDGINRLSDDLHHFDKWATGELSGLEKTVTGLGRSVAHIATDVIGDAEKVAKGAWHDFAAGLDAVRHDVAHLTDDIGGELASITKAAENDVAAAVSALERDVIKPLEHDVLAGLRDLGKGADRLWHILDRDVIRPIEKDAEDALHDAKKALSWLDHEGLDAVRLVKRCWHWLELMAKWPVHEIEDLPRALRHVFTVSGAEREAHADDWIIKALDRTLDDLA